MSGMYKKSTLKGMWWVKGNETDKFTGILTYGEGYLPTLEIFPKRFEIRSQKVPNHSTIYGEVFEESKEIQAVTLLECKSENGFGLFSVGAYLHNREYVRADCAAIGMQLDNDEIAQVQSPQDIHLTCTGLDEYSMVRTVDYVWKDNIPQGRAYRVSDIERISYTPPEPIEIAIDIGTITIYMGPSSTARDVTSRYRIHVSLENPTPKDRVNSLIYSQLLSFLSIMTGRREYVESHRITVDSIQTSSGSLGLELNYGHATRPLQKSEFDTSDALVLGTRGNMSKFATLFPNWRENFPFVKEVAFHYMWMADQPTETNLLQAYPHIETYALARLLKKNKKGMLGILSAVINSSVDYFHCSKLYARHFPTERRDHLANQLANFRHNRIHPMSGKECVFSLETVYAYISVIVRSIFLKEMEYSSEDIDNEISHWPLWRMLDGDEE